MTAHTTSPPHTPSPLHRHLVIWSLLLLLPGCKLFNTRQELAKQEIEYLDWHISYVQTLQQDFQSAPNPDLLHDASIFLSEEKLNNALALFDGLTFPLDSIPNAIITLERVRITGRDFAPELAVDARARRGNIGLKLSVRGLAFPEVPSGLDRVRLSFRLSRVVPDVSWKERDVDIGNFVRDLIQVTAAEYVRKIGYVEVPVGSDFTLAFGGTTTPTDIPTPDGRIEGTTTIPRIEVPGRIGPSKFYYLSDGLHIYMDYESSIPVATR